MKLIVLSIAAFLFMSCGQSEGSAEGNNGSPQTSEQQTDAIAQKLEISDFKKKLEEKENAIVLDVRTPQELQKGFVQGAVNYNFYDADFSSKVEALDREQPVFVYCAAGGRSGEAFEMLKSKGFKEVYDMVGGMNAWYAAGYPVEK